MCYYPAYSHKCGHTECVLQMFCSKAQMIQQKCGRGHEGIIMATVKVETSCENCPGKKVRQTSITLRLYIGADPSKQHQNGLSYVQKNGS